MATRDSIISALRTYLATVEVARDPSVTLLAYEGSVPFENSPGGLESFDVRTGAFELTQAFGVEGVRQWDGELIVLLGHAPFGTESEREGWTSRDVERISDLVENQAWTPEGVNAVWFLGQGEPNRSDPDWWVTELRFRIVYLDDGTSTVFTPPSAPGFTMDAARVNVAPVGNLASTDVQAALEEHQTGIDGLGDRVTAAEDQLVPADENTQGFVSKLAQKFAGLKTFVAGIAIGAGITFNEITGQIRSTVADTNGAVGLILDTSNAFTGSAQKLLSIRNGGTEKVYIGRLGEIVPSVSGGASIGSVALPWLEMHATNFRGSNLVASGGGFRVRFGNGSPTQVIGEQADGATAVGVSSDTYFTYANATSKIHSFRNAGVEKAYVDYKGSIVAFSNVIATNALLTNDGLVQKNAAPGPLRVYGTDPDVATAIGVIINNTASLTAAGAKIAEFRNAGLAKAYVDKDGNVCPVVTSVSTLGDSAHRWANLWCDQFVGTRVVVGGSGITDGNGGASVRIQIPVNGSSSYYYRGADGSGLTAHIFDSITTLAGSGMRLVSFRNGGSEKAYIDKNGGGLFNSVSLTGGSGLLAVGADTPLTLRGNLASLAHRVASMVEVTGKIVSFYKDNLVTEVAAIYGNGDIESKVAGAGVILTSPNGTRYRIVVADDGTLSTEAA